MQSKPEQITIPSTPSTSGIALEQQEQQARMLRNKNEALKKRKLAEAGIMQQGQQKEQSANVSSESTLKGPYATNNETATNETATHTTNTSTPSIALEQQARIQRNKNQASEKRERCIVATELKKRFEDDLVALLIKRLPLESQKKILQYDPLQPLSPNYNRLGMVSSVPSHYYHISLYQALFYKELSPLVEEMYKYRKIHSASTSFGKNVAAVQMKYGNEVLTSTYISRGSSPSEHSERYALREVINEAILKKKVGPLAHHSGPVNLIESNDLDAFLPYKDKLSAYEIDIFSDRAPCHSRNKDVVACEVFFAKILPKSSRIFFATPYLSYDEHNENAGWIMSDTLQEQYTILGTIIDCRSFIQLTKLKTDLSQQSIVSLPSEHSSVTTSVKDKNIPKQIYIKDEDVIKQLHEILSLLNIQTQSSDTQNENITKSTHRIEHPVILPEPKQHVEGKIMDELYTSFKKGKPIFKKFLSDKGLVRTKVSGTDLNCYIYSLLQHVAGEYDIKSYSAELMHEIKTAAKISPDKKIAMVYPDTPETLEIIKAINEKYQVNLEVHCFQIDDAGKHVKSSETFDPDNNKIQRVPVVLWLQVNHYVCITSSNLKHLISDKSSTLALSSRLENLSKQPKLPEPLLSTSESLTVQFLNPQHSLFGIENANDTSSQLATIIDKLENKYQPYEWEDIEPAIDENRNAEALANVVWKKIKEKMGIKREESVNFNDSFRTALKIVMAGQLEKDKINLETASSKNIALFLLEKWSLLIDVSIETANGLKSSRKNVLN